MIVSETSSFPQFSQFSLNLVVFQLQVGIYSCWLTLTNIMGYFVYVATFICITSYPAVPNCWINSYQVNNYVGHCKWCLV